MTRTLLLLLAIVAAIYLLLWTFQERLIYLPRRYAFPPESLPAPLAALPYATPHGEQRAVWVPPKGPGPDGAPARLWVVFGGNGMVALDWLDWVMRHPDRGAGFLLVDYPGYGWSAGRPDRARIVANARAAFEALAKRLGLAPAALGARTYLLGHSLGAAVALEFAAAQPPRGIVLSAPFTSLADVAAHHYGRWVLPVLTERWDNRAGLAALATRPGGLPPTVVVQGDADEVIPFRQGRALAATQPGVRFVPVAGGHHNDLYDLAPTVLREAMDAVAR